MSDAEYMKEVKDLAAKLEAKNALPGDAALSLEQVRALLAKTHETVVDKDDPILMVVTILSVHLAGLEKLHARHKEGLGKLTADKTDAYVSGVQEGIANSRTAFLPLRWMVSARSLTIIRPGSRRSKTARPGSAAILGVSALLNVAVFVMGELR